ncbi:MAG: hypothetical protein SNJ59_12150 [Aggregatilineales bacterium]
MLLRFPSIASILLLLMALVAQAQPEPTPIIAWARGDLWRLDPVEIDAAPRQLTRGGVISAYALSPDGRTIAFKAAAPLGLDVLDQIEATGFIAEFDLPADIYLLDVATSQIALVAGQPDDASLLAADRPDRAFVRSAPVWSPDGLQIAWTEFDFSLPVSPPPRLIVYDLATRTAHRAIDSIPAAITFGSAPALIWGTSAVVVSAGSGADGALQFLFFSLNADRPAELLAVARVPPPSAEAQEIAWIADEDEGLLGILLTTADWILIDPRTGNVQPVEATPLLYSTAAGDDSLGLRFGALPQTGMFWETVELGGATAASAAYVGAPGRVALSPNGREVAFLGYPTYAAAAIWEAGGLLPLPATGEGVDRLEVGSLIWGPMAWRLGPRP